MPLPSSTFNAIQLTNSAEGAALANQSTSYGQSHSVFYNSMVSDANFKTDFTFRIKDPGDVDSASQQSGDGLVFVLQNSSPGNSEGYSLGSNNTPAYGSGGNIGFEGRFADSLGVGLDTWDNSTPGNNVQLGPNDLGIDFNGSVSHLTTNNGAEVVVPINFYNTQLWHVWITYDGTTLSVYASDLTNATQPASPILSEQVDIPHVIGSPFAFAGLTAATGGGYDTTNLLSWNYGNYNNQAPPLPSNPGVLVDFAPYLLDAPTLPAPLPTPTTQPMSATGIGTGFYDIQNVVGSAGPNYLRGAGGWTIGGPNGEVNSGTLTSAASPPAYSATFEGFQNLEAAAANPRTGKDKSSTFTFNQGSTLSGSLFTGDGNAWVYLAPGVTINGNVAGGELFGNYSYAPSITGLNESGAVENGLDHLDRGRAPFDANATADSLIVYLAPGANVFGGIQGSYGTDVLDGTNLNVSQSANVYWDIAGPNAGNVTDATPSGIGFSFVDQFPPLVPTATALVASTATEVVTANLTGGTALDEFKFETNGSINGKIDGGAGSNWLNYTNYGLGVIVNLTTGSATGVAGGAAGDVANVLNVLGSNIGNTLTGSPLGSILVGGSGNDTISDGGSGRSILIGGSGSDTLSAGADQDILIAGTVTFNSAIIEGALQALMNEWQQTGESYSQQVYNIENGGGLTGGYRLAMNVTVFDDGFANYLFGTNPLDLIFT